MIKQLKTIVAAALLLGPATAATAQSFTTEADYTSPYTFIGVQGGGQVTFTNYKASKLITPVGALSVGHFFTPVVGTRLNVSGWKNKGGFESINKTYDYNYVTSDLDLLFNLSNIFCKPKGGKPHVFNAYLIGGVGLTYAWDNDDFNALSRAGLVNEPLAWEDNRLVHNFRVGTQLEFNLTKNVAFNVEVTANNLHDRFNSKTNGNNDWQLNAMAGFNFKFGYKKKKVKVAEPAPAPAPAPQPKPEPAPQPKPEPKPEPKPAPVTPQKREMSINVFFLINSSEVRTSEEAKVKSLADFMKENPQANVELMGYADAGTGTNEINDRLSKERSEAVAKLLTEKYGISASRISKGSKGSHVQPFTDNDSNRAVIGIAK